MPTVLRPMVIVLRSQPHPSRRVAKGGAGYARLLWSYCHMSYDLVSYGHTVICPMVLLSYILWPYYGPTVVCPIVV